MGRELAGPVPIVYAENDPLDLGRLLPNGTDIWLNAASKTRKAFGANGMTPVLIGMPSRSVLDA